MAKIIKKKTSTKSKTSIRMYNVGFGDCFLLFVPTSEGIKKILIDCGSLKNKSKSISEIAADVIEECKDADGVSRIDIVIMTHRHADHISGFVPGTWDKVEVGEVWMPWMESLTDESARNVRASQMLATQFSDLESRAMKLMSIALSIAAVTLVAAAPARADGDAMKGEKTFKKCMACHTATEKTNKVGP